MSQMYTVWKLRFSLSLQDPDVPGVRYHTTIFVETDPTGHSGDIHHVTGDITSQQGMHYEKKFRDDPRRSRTFNSREFLGYTDASTYPQSWQTLLARVPAPHQQKAFNTKTMRTEPFKSLNPLTFYEPGEARPPLIKCTEWTEQRAIPSLQAAGLIKSQADPTAATSSARTQAPTTQTTAAQAASTPGWVWDETYQRYRFWDGRTQQWVWG